MGKDGGCNCLMVLANMALVNMIFVVMVLVILILVILIIGGHGIGDLDSR